MTRTRRSGLAVCGLFFLSATAEAAVKYVKPTASGSGDCGSWANACTLPTSLTAAQSGDEVWVKAGSYAPIILKNGVKIIGGFAGTETLASQSNPALPGHTTGIDGGGTTQCVTGSDNGTSTVLRGFTLLNGRGDEGGAIYLNNSSAVFVQCIITGNSANEFGGAVSIRGSSSPHFVNCTFSNNGDANGQLPYGGGAVFVHRGSPTFTNCLFFNNRAGEGGVLLVVFGTPTFINCTMSANQAGIGYGGAIHDQDGRVTLKNSILWNNTTTRGVGEADQIMSGSGGTTLARYCNIQGGWIGSTNINADPQFQDAAGYNYHLQQASPCKNAGENAALPPDVGNLDWDMDTDETTPFDLFRFVRTFGTNVDSGAYELGPASPGGGEE